MKDWASLGLVVFIAAGLFAAGCSEQEKKETPGATSNPSQANGAVPGVTDTEIVLGTHMPLSGSPAATYAGIADGMRAYFEYVNSQGGVYERKIKLIVGDDHFSPPVSLEVVRKLVEQDGVFAIVGGLGDETHLAAMDYLEERGVPDLFVGGGVAQFTDPVVKTRFGMVGNYETASEIGVDYLKQNFAGKTMGILYENDNAGKTGMEKTVELLKDSDIKVVSKQGYDFEQFDLTAQMQRIKADNPDFVNLMANAGAAANAIKVSREVLDWDVAFIVGASAATDLLIILAGPENAEGTLGFAVEKQMSDTDDPGVQRVVELMEQFAPGVGANNVTEYGVWVAELMVQALKNAGPDLTRESVIQGAEKIRDYCCITCLGPVNLSPTDHVVQEAYWPEKVVDGKWTLLSDDAMSRESTPGKVIACRGAGEPVYAGQE